MNKVQYLCKQCPKNEWCGLLFYKMEGSLENEATIIPEHIHFKDIGSASYTEQNADEDEVDLLIENPQFVAGNGYYQGFIHSHNTMKTVFSSTDDEDVHASTPLFPVWFSMIVNNFGDVVAQVSRMGSSINKIQTQDQDNNPITVKVEMEDKVMMTYDCIIEREDTIEEPKELAKRFREVKAKQEANQKKSKIKKNKYWESLKNVIDTEPETDPQLEKLLITWLVQDLDTMIEYLPSVFFTQQVQKYTPDRYKEKLLETFENYVSDIFDMGFGALDPMLMLELTKDCIGEMETLSVVGEHFSAAMETLKDLRNIYLQLEFTPNEQTKI